MRWYWKKKEEWRATLSRILDGISHNTSDWPRNSNKAPNVRELSYLPYLGFSVSGNFVIWPTKSTFTLYQPKIRPWRSDRDVVYMGTDEKVEKESPAERYWPHHPGNTIYMISKEILNRMAIPGGVISSHYRCGELITARFQAAELNRIYAQKFLRYRSIAPVPSL